ncbi:hypothetical protein LTR39_005911 [Cryomyces antarcticus]|nr:hypothetical protein LTR39_005911 [Cryomyces antarcticus]
MAESDTPHRGIPPSNDGLSAARVAFPQTVEDFEKDPRVAFSKLEDKYLLEDDDGSEWEFDERLKRRIPSPPREARAPSPYLTERALSLWLSGSSNPTREGGGKHS